MDKYELYHAGVKGMKWGIRRYQNKDGSLTPEGRKRYGQTTRDAFGRVTSGVKTRLKTASDKRKAKKEAEKAEEERRQKDAEEIRQRHKPVRSLTESELQTRIKRLQLEKQYKDLVKEVEATSRGRKIVEDILESSIKNIGTQTVTHLFGQGINKVAKDVFGFNGNYVNPKKGQKEK